MSRDHSPHETEIHTITVSCGTSGPNRDYFDGSAHVATLADLEAFTAELRRLGASSDAAIDNAFELRVTFSVKH